MIFGSGEIQIWNDLDENSDNKKQIKDRYVIKSVWYLLKLIKKIDIIYVIRDKESIFISNER